MKAYRYTTSTASFTIYPNNGWWGLMMNGRKVNDYATPDAAAYDVSAQNIGETEWDMMEDVPMVPEMLQDWEAIDFDPREDRPRPPRDDPYWDSQPLDSSMGEL